MSTSSSLLKTLKHLGSGSYAQAFLSVNPETNDLFAVKRIPLQILTDDEKRQTLKEIEILKLFSDHFNIVKYHYYRIIDCEGEEVMNDISHQTPNGKYASKQQSNSIHGGKPKKLHGCQDDKNNDVCKDDLNESKGEDGELYNNWNRGTRNQQFSVNHTSSGDDISSPSSHERPNLLNDDIINNKRLDIVMEYCDQGNLEEYLKARDGKLLSEKEIMHIFVQICYGLSYVHGKKILHRDLKSQNIFLKTYELNRTKILIAKLGDFGISKVLEGTQALAKTMVGTPLYISPELINDEPYGMKSDMWSLGCILYNLCTMKHAWNGNSFPAIVLKIATKDYEPISNIYSEDLKNILKLLLQKNPKKRISVNELLKLPYMKQHLDKYIEKLESLELSQQLQEIRSKSMIEIVQRPRSKSDGHRLKSLSPTFSPNLDRFSIHPSLQSSPNQKRSGLEINTNINSPTPATIRCKLSYSPCSEESEEPILIRVSLANRNSLESTDSFSSFSSADLTPKSNIPSKIEFKNKEMKVEPRKIDNSNKEKQNPSKNSSILSTPVSRARSRSVHVDTRPECLKNSFLNTLLDDSISSDSLDGTSAESYDSFEEIPETPSSRKIPQSWKSKHETNISNMQKELEDRLSRSMELKELRLQERRNELKKRLQEQYNALNENNQEDDPETVPSTSSQACLRVVSNFKPLEVKASFEEKRRKFFLEKREKKEREEKEQERKRAEHNFRIKMAQSRIQVRRKSFPKVQNRDLNHESDTSSPLAKNWMSGLEHKEEEKVSTNHVSHSPVSPVSPRSTSFSRQSMNQQQNTKYLATSTIDTRNLSISLQSPTSSISSLSSSSSSTLSHDYQMISSNKPSQEWSSYSQKKTTISTFDFSPTKKRKLLIRSPKKSQSSSRSPTSSTSSEASSPRDKFTSLRVRRKITLIGERGSSSIVDNQRPSTAHNYQVSPKTPNVKYQSSPSTINKSRPQTAYHDINSSKANNLEFEVHLQEETSNSNHVPHSNVRGTSIPRANSSSRSSFSSPKKNILSPSKLISTNLSQSKHRNSEYRLKSPDNTRNSVNMQSGRTNRVITSPQKSKPREVYSPRRNITSSKEHNQPKEITSPIRKKLSPSRLPSPKHKSTKDLDASRRNICFKSQLTSNREIAHIKSTTLSSEKLAKAQKVDSKRNSFPTFELVLPENLVERNIPNLEHISILTRVVTPSTPTESLTTTEPPYFQKGPSYISTHPIQESSNGRQSEKHPTKFNIHPSQPQNDANPAYNYPFNISNPIYSLKQSLQSSLREQNANIQDASNQISTLLEQSSMMQNPGELEKQLHNYETEHPFHNDKDEENVVPCLQSSAISRTNMRHPPSVPSIEEKEHIFPLRLGTGPPTPSEVAHRQLQQEKQEKQ